MSRVSSKSGTRIEESEASVVSARSSSVTVGWSVVVAASCSAALAVDVASTPPPVVGSFSSGVGLGSG
jgi:hypothetical protein